MILRSIIAERTFQGGGGVNYVGVLVSKPTADFRYPISSGMSALSFNEGNRRLKQKFPEQTLSSELASLFSGLVGRGKNRAIRSRLSTQLYEDGRKDGALRLCLGIA